MRLSRAILSLALLGGPFSCSHGTSYELRGQILAVDQSRQELTVAHGDIRGFMPGMTMAFKVTESALMANKAPGDFIVATLVVEPSRVYLTSVTVTGRGPLTEPAPTIPTFDLLARGDTAPDARLVDQDGAERHLSDWRGQVLAVTFIYTRCPLPDFCPLMDRRFVELQREATADAQLRNRLHLLSISIDPDFDTPAVLIEHARRVGARPDVWSFLTGDRSELHRFGSRFGVSVMRNSPGEADVVHNLRTAVIDPQGRVATIVSGNEWTPADLLKELRRAAGSH